MYKCAETGKEGAADIGSLEEQAAVQVFQCELRFPTVYEVELGSLSIVSQANVGTDKQITT